MGINRIFRAPAKARPSTKPATLQAPQGFVAVPTPQATGGMANLTPWQQEIYRLAYERAKAAATPLHYRRFFSVWN